MTDEAAPAPILLIKKIAGVALLILGLLLTVLGYGNSSRGLLTFGVLVLIGGLVLLVLKIFRRNQP
jgi:hypothetical protein